MIPVFIIAFNNFTYVRDTVNQLLKYTSDIYIVDNCSSFIPLLEYYDEIKENIKIVRMDKNYGSEVCNNPIIQALIPGEFYCITDPDLKFNKNLPIDFIDKLAHISKKYNSLKVGFALDIQTDIDDTIIDNFGRSIKECESRYWDHNVKDDEYAELYWAEIDTTFCLNNKSGLYQHIRVGGDFTAIHRPWLTYWKDEIPTDELDFYKKTSICSTWIS